MFVRASIPIPTLTKTRLLSSCGRQPQITYMKERRKQLGGYLPERKAVSADYLGFGISLREFYKGTGGA